MAYDLSMPNLREAIGLTPVRVRMRQALFAIRGMKDVPPTKSGLSSLTQLHPRIAPQLWLGKQFVKRHAIISNLFNHTQTPIEEGWSVKRTQVRDFRGGDLTYDSHNGTDFAVPRGTPILAAASGKVGRVWSEFHRGGLKVLIDHGNGVMTSTAHLARAFVREGQIVKRGEIVALSGYSGLDSLITFPFGIPHIHFNVWLNGVPVDPFPHGSEPSLWRAGTLPQPTHEGDLIEDYEPAKFDKDRLDEIIRTCITPAVRERLEHIAPLDIRACHTNADQNYYPTRFPARGSIYQEQHERQPLLDLPLPAESYDGVVFVDEI